MLKTRQHIGYAAFIACVMLRTATAFVVPAGVKPLAAPATEPSIQIIMSGQNDSALRLEARLAPLGKILNELAAKTGAVIHYSVLPEAPVTATCAGTNILQLMDCLVAKQVGLVANKPEPGKPAEFWLLGTSVGSCKAMTVEVAASQVSAAVPPPPPTAAEQAEIDRAQQEQTEAMLKLIKSKDANERYSAISNLSSLAAKNDPAIDQVLRDATLDNDTNVRSQAIVASAQRSGDDADRQLGLALKDKNVNVRMAVVSAVNSDTAILRQALNDSDSGVRGLAQSKLDQLDKLEMRQSQ